MAQQVCIGVRVSTEKAVVLTSKSHSNTRLVVTFDVVVTSVLAIKRIAQFSVGLIDEALLILNALFGR